MDSPRTPAAGLAERMKAYENRYRVEIPRRLHTVIRVDGRGFSSYLRHADRPYDIRVMAAMDAAAEALCNDISGALLAFTQSDEVSVLLLDRAPISHPWFGGVTAKMLSIAAAGATRAFNAAYGRSKGAMFDARVFTLPDATEAMNYLIWRQRDTIRNSIAMTAQAHFSHRRLNGIDTVGMRALLLAEKGIDWAKLPEEFRRGRLTTRCTGEREIAYTDKRTGNRLTGKALRSWWATGPAPSFTAAPDGALASLIPGATEAIA